MCIFPQHSLGKVNDGMKCWMMNVGAVINRPGSKMFRIHQKLWKIRGLYCRAIDNRPYKFFPAFTKER